MPKRRHALGSSRRNFLKGAGFAGTAAVVVPPVAGIAFPATPRSD